MKTLSILAVLIFACFVVFVAFTGRTYDSTFAIEVLACRQKLVKNFVDRVLNPQIEKIRAAGEEKWLPEAGASLNSIIEGYSSDSVTEIHRAYEKAQSIVTRCLTLEKISSSLEGPINKVHPDEVKRILKKRELACYASAKLRCESISAGYDGTWVKLDRVQTLDELREIRLSDGVQLVGLPSVKELVAGNGP